MKPSKLETLKAAERAAALAWGNRPSYKDGPGLVDPEAAATCKTLWGTWQVAAKAVREEVERLAKIADAKRRKSAKLRTPGETSRASWDAVSAAGKETIWLAIQGGAIIARCTTHATKSRTWGYVWRASGCLPHTDYFVGATASGCGYCKESAAVSQWLSVAIEGAKECHGAGMDAAESAFRDAVILSLKLSGKSTKNLVFVRA